MPISSSGSSHIAMIMPSSSSRSRPVTFSGSSIDSVFSPVDITQAPSSPAVTAALEFNARTPMRYVVSYVKPSRLYADRPSGTVSVSGSRASRCAAVVPMSVATQAISIAVASTCSLAPNSVHVSNMLSYPVTRTSRVPPMSGALPVCAWAPVAPNSTSADTKMPVTKRERRLCIVMPPPLPSSRRWTLRARIHGLRRSPSPAPCRLPYTREVNRSPFGRCHRDHPLFSAAATLPPIIGQRKLRL